MRRAGLLAASLCSLAVLCGCAVGGGSVADVPAPEGVSVSVLQYRSDQTPRRIQIKVRNDGDRPVTVLAARLTSARFTPDAVWGGQGPGQVLVVQPGTATDLPAPLGRAACEAEATEPGVVRLRVRTEAGDEGDVSLPPTDPYGALQRIHTDDCRRAAVLAVATPALQGPLQVRRMDGALQAVVTLVLTPTGRAGSVTVESAAETTLLDNPGGAGWPIGLTVDAGSGPRKVELPLRPARCDPHAVADDKIGTVLPLTVRLNGGARGLVTVPASAQLRGEIYSFVRTACS